jgi:hypothetical protein
VFANQGGFGETLRLGNDGRNAEGLSREAGRYDDGGKELHGAKKIWKYGESKATAWGG